MSLLEDAKKVREKNNSNRIDITDEHIELSLAYLKKEISLSQATAALYPNKELKTGTAGVYSTMIRSLVEAYKQGMLIIK